MDQFNVMNVEKEIYSKTNFYIIAILVVMIYVQTAQNNLIY